MSWVDLVILALVVLAGLNGVTKGAIRQVANLVGLGAGFVIGTIVAPSLSTDFTHAHWRPVLALGIVMAAALVGGRLGGLLGSLAARSLHSLKLGFVDKWSGLAIGVAGALVGCWMFAGLLSASSSVTLSNGIQNSLILKSLDKVMPPVPSIEARVQSLFRNANFPSVFASVVAPTLPPPVSPKSLGPLVRSLAGPTDIVKVLASGPCAQSSEGTGFFYAPHLLLTNAHVVSGETSVTINGAPAQVALYDPNDDLAVLRVASLTETPLSFLSGKPAVGARVEVIGFPLDATRTGAPGVIEGELSGHGRDIYNQNLEWRTTLAVEVNIQPGNSGSPVLVGRQVAGVIESESLSQPSTAYAIPLDVVRRDIAKVPATGTQSTQGCLP